MKPFSSSMMIMAITILLAIMTKTCEAQDSPQDFLDAHNEARAQVGADLSPLEWDDTVAEYAQSYAETRASDCSLIHSETSYGENLAMSTGDLSGTDAVKMWVDEAFDYDYDSNSCRPGKQCGHYTQVVWRDTLRVGCAKVQCDYGGTFITCNYDPPGNYIGEWPYDMKKNSLII